MGDAGKVVGDAGKVIVNFSQIAALSGGNEAAVNQKAAAVAPNDLVFGRFMGKALSDLKNVQTTSTVLSSPDSQQGALLQSFLADYAAHEGKMQQTATGGLEAKFDDHDFLRWIYHAAWPKMRSYLGLPKRYRRKPWEPKPVRLPSGARIALFGDWGTGLYGAPVIRDTIAGIVPGFDAVVHLGDVYYAGREDEVRDQLLRMWPTVEGAVNRACNSNHEMYSSGKPYFTQTLQAFDQPSSTFVLETPEWLVIGLDTAYDDATVGDDQLRWLNGVLADRGDRGLVLLSHHHLLSHHKTLGVALASQFRTLLDSRAITAWYWGHEHLHAIYAPHPKWGVAGRCVGHGGYPYFRPHFGGAEAKPACPSLGLEWRILQAADDDIPEAWFLDGPNPYVEEDPPKYGPHGYMTLELHPDRIVEASVLADGTPLWSSEIVRRRP